MEEGKQVILLSLNEDIQELKALAESLNHSVVDCFIQKRQKPNPRTYIGSGKAEEIRQALTEDSDIELALVNGNMRPSQLFKLKLALGVEVLDRTRLILEIFEKNAHTPEARLQVELARIEYEIPLVKESLHQLKLGEKPGFQAGGEYQIDYYYEMIKTRMGKLRSALKRIEKERDLKRRQRGRRGFYQVSLVGYTNVGKSSLLNALTDDHILVEDRLFSTLSTTTRRLEGLRRQVLLTDTVGFIRNTPPTLLEAFHSTLEESYLADVLLIVLDVTDPPYLALEKLEVSMNLLGRGDCTALKVCVLNKCDAADSLTIEKMREAILSWHRVEELSGTLEVSAKTQEGLERLMEEIGTRLPELVQMELTLTNTPRSQSLLSWLHDNAVVEKVEYGATDTGGPGANFGIKIFLECEKRMVGEIQKKAGQVDKKW